VGIIGIALATPLFAVVAIESEIGWRSFRAIYLARAVHVIRKVLRRQTAIVNHVLAF
jgi:uncharacterized membrane protein YbjE (DUF340 family)